MRGGMRGGASSSGRKAPSKYSDKVNGNTPLFTRPKSAAIDALQRWSLAHKGESVAPVGVVSLPDEEQPNDASINAEAEREQAAFAALEPAQPDAQTWNGDASFSSTRCARIDLFFQMVRGADRASIQQLVSRSWGESPEHTVALVQHARDARGGKGERLVSLHAMLWLRVHKPATYLLNLTTFLALGYFKDLLHLAVAVDQLGLQPLGASEREDLKRKAEGKDQGRRGGKRSKRREGDSPAKEEAASSSSSPRPVSDAASSSEPAPVQYEVLELELLAQYLRDDWERLQKHQAKYGLAQPRQPRDNASQQSAKAEPKLEEREMDVDEEEQKDQPQEEQQEEEKDGEWEEVDASASSAAVAPADAAKKAPRPRRIPHLQLSLASKWAPSEGSSFDKKHHLAKRLARLLFPHTPQCFRLYREALSACRTHLQVAERFMCEKRFDEIDFEALPAKCHQLLRKALAKHCGDRYTEYQSKLRRGVAKINTAGVMPHELASPYILSRAREVDDTLEGAWTTLLAKLKASCVSSGGLKNAISVVDVSGSMMCYNGLPMAVAISLGLLVSELAAGPFQHRVITFSSEPQWHKVPTGCSLLKQCQSLQGMNWGMSTNLEKVFTLVLNTAQSANVPAADMPSTIFIFSDMQFDSAVSDKTSSFDRIRQRYANAGYPLPQLVFWNLNGAAKGFPVDISTPGVALIGGYSAELLKAFLEGQPIEPMSILLHTIKEYKPIIEESER